MPAIYLLYIYIYTAFVDSILTLLSQFSVYGEEVISSGGEQLKRWPGDCRKFGSRTLYCLFNCGTRCKRADKSERERERETGPVLCVARRQVTYLGCLVLFSFHSSRLPGLSKMSAQLYRTPL